MPAPNSKTEAIERLRLLLAVLTSDWQDRDALIERIGIYPDAEMSARAMLRADMRALLALGFQVERTDAHHDPQWRVVGHERFGVEVQVKFCKRCGQWRLLRDFYRDAIRASQKSTYCRYCNRTQASNYQHENADLVSIKQKAWRRKFPERRRAIERRSQLRRRQQKENDGTV